jgi:diguanylate cyclase (GGDEF)-like protein
MSSSLWRAHLVLGAAAVAGCLVLPGVTAKGALTTLLNLSCAMAIVVGVRWHRPPNPWPWYCLASGHLLFVVGEFVYIAGALSSGGPRFPSAADGLFLFGNLVLLGGLLLLVRRRMHERDTAGLIDATVAATGVGVLFWVFLIQPVAASSHITPLAQLVSIAYPVIDVLLVAVVVRLLIGGGRRGTAFTLIVVGSFLKLLADAGWGYFGLDGTSASGAIGACWQGFFVVWGAAALHPSMRCFGEPTARRASGHAHSRLLLLAGVSVLAPIVLMVQATRNQFGSTEVIAGGAAILSLLVLARMSGLLHRVQDQAARLEALAREDALTGVANRRRWDDELERALARAYRGVTAVHVALLDLDHFKRFNDHNGHPAGDGLLKEAASAWRAQLRPSDLLARYGGEEFAVLLEMDTSDDAFQAIERLRPGTPKGQTFSAGVATWDGVETASELVGRADAAMYEAKRAGRDRVLVALAAPTEPPAAPADLDGQLR